MQSSAKHKLGWGLSILIALFLIGPSAVGKFVEWEGKSEMFEKLGVTIDLIQKIGVLEIIVALLYVLPRTGFIGAILLTGYLGGAIMTHLRVGDPFVFPIIIGVLAWIALGLRRPAVFSLAAGAPVSTVESAPAQVD
ncbi:MAG: DoxX family protein [Planctomycetaceae bacterium]|nr:DoxX family protein [Planctomycetaceae bacterium]